MKRCIAWFKKYCSIEDPDVLAPEGMERFCRDIEVDPENIVMLGKLKRALCSFTAALEIDEKHYLIETYRFLQCWPIK